MRPLTCGVEARDSQEMSVRQIASHPLPGSACGLRLWRQVGALHATFVVKATFELVPDGPMTHVAPQPVLPADEHHDDSPSRSLRRAGELAPFLPRCDVTLHGHCHAPAGQVAPAVGCRLALLRDQQPLIERVVHVFGDRALGSDGAAGAPAAFDRMPLEYERAIVSTENPSGRQPAGTSPPGGHPRAAR